MHFYVFLNLQYTIIQIPSVKVHDLMNICLKLQQKMQVQKDMVRHVIF